MAYTVPNPFELDLTREFLAEQSFAPLVAGDTVTWRFQARDEADIALNLTGASAAIHIYASDAATTALHSRAATLDAGQTAEVGSTGKGWFAFAWAPADLTTMTALVGRKFYQVILTLANGDVRTICTGRVDILRHH